MTANHDGLAEEPDDHEPVTKAPSAAEQWRIMVERGDVRGLLNDLGRAHGGLVSFTDLGEHLSKALDVLARTNPMEYAKFLSEDVLAAAGRDGQC